MNPYSGLEIFVVVGSRTFSAKELGISEMVVTDVDEGDNEIELTIPDNDYRITDSEIFKVGSLMGISWGFSNGQITQMRTGYVILKPSTAYTADGVIAKVIASTKSATLAARRPQTMRGPSSLKSIISEIAQRNGLTLTIKGGNERLSNFASASWSDREVVSVLANRFGYQATYKSNELIFAPRDYGASPSIELIFAQGDKGNIISADLQVDAKKAMGDSSTSAVSVDPNTKKVVSAVSKESDKALAISAEDGHSWATKLGSIISPGAVPVMNPASIVQMLPPKLQADFTALMTSPDHSPDNLQGLASGENQVKQKKKGELSVTSIGFIHATARQIINVIGLAKRDSGKWYAVSVEHHIKQADAYEVKWELSRHGNNSKGTGKNKSPLNNQSAVVGGKVKIVTAINAETGVLTK